MSGAIIDLTIIILGHMITGDCLLLLWVLSATQILHLAAALKSHFNQFHL